MSAVAEEQVGPAHHNVALKAHFLQDMCSLFCIYIKQKKVVTGNCNQNPRFSARSAGT